jgi:hypothetical protein
MRADLLLECDLPTLKDTIDLNNWGKVTASWMNMGYMQDSLVGVERCMGKLLSLPCY